MVKTIADAFGADFDKQLKLENAKKSPRLKLEGVIKQQIIKAVKENLKADAPQLHYPLNNQIYHIILGETAEELTRRQMKYGESIGPLKWKNQRVSLTSSDKELLDKIQPSTAYVLVGVLKTTPRQDGGVWYNFRLDGLITMDEIVDFTAKGDKKL